MISCFISRVSALTNGHLFDKIDSVLTGVPLKFLGHKYLRLKKKNHETDVHILLMAFWCRSSIPFFTSRKWRYFVCVSLTCELHFCFNRQYEMVSFTVEPKTQRKRDRAYLESNGSKQCETGGMLTNKHYESILFYPCILIIRHWEWGLLHLMSDIFPMPKGTPNKMQHKEDRIVCSSFSCPYLGWCSMLFQLFAAETTLIGQWKAHVLVVLERCVVQVWITVVWPFFDIRITPKRS